MFSEIKALTLEEARRALMHKVLVFTDPTKLDYEIDYFAGQKARVVGIADESEGDSPEDAVYDLKLDFTEFETYNQILALPVYPENGTTKKYHETEFYPSDKRNHVFVGCFPDKWPFEICEDGNAISPVILTPQDWKKITDHVGVEKIKELGVKPI